MTTIWYNEFDPFAAEWLRNLGAAGHIPPGIVDERSIADVQTQDLAGVTQAHFFAGIGGWPYALRLAGWGDRPVWTGSCPCQPFSVAGKRRGAEDHRDLWPVWFRLIRECRPDCIFGEQVAGAIGHGWLDRVSADLEAAGYAVGAVVLGAHSVGAPHRRQRLYWVGYSGNARRSRSGTRTQSRDEIGQPGHDGGEIVGMAHSELRRREQRDAGQRTISVVDENRVLANAACGRLRADGSASGDTGHDQRCNPWRDAVWLRCADGKARRAPDPGAGVRIVAARLPNRVGALRGSGNAICPQTAAVFVTAFMQELGLLT